MRDGGGREGLAKVGDVGAEDEPLRVLADREGDGKREIEREKKRERRTEMARAGSAVTTASANTIEITLGGLCASGRKMWWTSGFFS